MMDAEIKATPVDAGRGEKQSADLSPLVDAIGAIGKRIESLEGKLLDTSRDPERQYRDAYAKRDQYKQERDDLAAKLADLTAKVDASTAERDKAVARVERRHALVRALEGAGVLRPAAALKAVDFGDADLDALTENDAGVLDVADLLAKITAAVPEIVKVQEPEPAPGPTFKRPVPPVATGGSGSAVKADGSLDRSAMRIAFDASLANLSKNLKTLGG